MILKEKDLCNSLSICLTRGLGQMSSWSPTLGPALIIHYGRNGNIHIIDDTTKSFFDN